MCNFERGNDWYMVFKLPPPSKTLTHILANDDLWPLSRKQVCEIGLQLILGVEGKLFSPLSICIFVLMIRDY